MTTRRRSAPHGRHTADQQRAAAEDLTRAGGQDALVEIVEYDETWPAAFEAERTRLAPLLEGAEIHHFGSTAVPGLAAKPVVDMIALVNDLDALIPGLVERGGYQFPVAFNKTLPRRRFLCYPTAAHRTHHLHLVDDPDELTRRLRFRDRLRADPALAVEYATLKRDLAARYRDDREAYTDSKAPFVKRWSAAP
ncbi:MAG: GrpB family protein [Solirubrobacteraceae bacterium]